MHPGVLHILPKKRVNQRKTTPCVHIKPDVGRVRGSRAINPPPNDSPNHLLAPPISEMYDPKASLWRLARPLSAKGGCPHEFPIRVAQEKRVVDVRSGVVTFKVSIPGKHSLIDALWDC